MKVFLSNGISKVIRDIIVAKLSSGYSCEINHYLSTGILGRDLKELGNCTHVFLSENMPEEFHSILRYTVGRQLLKYLILKNDTQLSQSDFETVTFLPSTISTLSRHLEMIHSYSEIPF
jgi:hypothetical protein